ncbi:MAG: hypothetical protein JWM68_3018 [Verrucomicrobiales bacterium]|nr:hypothetical protein [Verrucomicrobiales bacterium]
MLPGVELNQAAGRFHQNVVVNSGTKIGVQTALTDPKVHSNQGAVIPFDDRSIHGRRVDPTFNGEPASRPYICIRGAGNSQFAGPIEMNSLKNFTG